VRRVGAQIRSGTAEQPHIAPVLTSLRRAAADVADGPLECRPVLHRVMAPVASTA